MNLPVTIIAAENFSPLSHHATTYAAELAKATGANLLLFNAFKISIHSANSNISARELQSQIDRSSLKLQSFANQLSESHGIKVTSLCSFSILEDHLMHLVKETQAELIVMGMSDKSIEQELLGNPTTSVIKNVPVPVLAVPMESKFSDLKKVLFACDTFRPLLLKKVTWLRNAVSSMKLEIEVFSVDKKMDGLKAQNVSLATQNILEAEFQNVKYLYKTVRSNSVISEIEKEIDAYTANLLVMMPQEYGFWDSLIHRSKTRLMASGLKIPLLSIPNF